MVVSKPGRKIYSSKSIFNNLNNHKSMVGLFTFDGPMYKDKNGVYCNTYITNEILNRFYVVVDKIMVLIRTIEIEEDYTILNLNKLEVSSKLEVVELPNIHSPISYLTRWRYKDFLTKVVEQSDMYFLRIPSVISDMVATICKEKGKPYCVEVGGCSFDAYWNHGIVGRVIAPSMYIHQRKTVRDAKYATYVTTQWLQKRYPTNAVLSTNASNVYLTDFDNEKAEKKSRSFVGKAERYTLGTIANYEVKYKGQHKVIKALSILKSKGIIVRYELVGGGNPSHLKKIAEDFGVQDQIIFHGLLKKKEVFEWLYNNVDVYIQPSKQEGLPRSVIEAMNQGCVCIGSNIAGMPELLEPDELFNPNHVKDISMHIEAIIESNNNSKRSINNFKKSKRFTLSLLNESRNSVFKAYRESLNTI